MADSGIKAINCSVLYRFTGDEIKKQMEKPGYL